MTIWESREFRRFYASIYRSVYYRQHKAEIIRYAEKYNAKYPKRLRAAQKRYYEKNKLAFSMYQQLNTLFRKESL